MMESNGSAEPCTNALDALFSAIEGSATLPEIDPMLMIDPLVLITGIIARQTFKPPLALVPMTFSQSSSVLFRNLFSICIPALFTRICNDGFFGSVFPPYKHRAHPN